METQNYTRGTQSAVSQVFDDTGSPISYCCAKVLHITNMTCREMCKIKREIFQTVDNIKAQQSKPTKLNKI
jgi:hypothetical protein